MSKLLIFDCEEEIAVTLKGIFEEKGYQVVIAASYEDVVKKAGAERPNILFLDLMLHMGSGYEDVIRQVRKASPETQIIVTTAIDKELEISRALNSGAVRCVPKPCDMEDLERILEEAASGKASDPSWGWENTINDVPPQY
jgi:two-component system response regulator (stage 0 sporulation protein F)